MANEQNLIQNSDRTPSERRENARKAGIASGKARRDRRTAKETAELMLALSIQDADAEDIESIQSLGGLKGVNITVLEAGVLAQVKKMLKGDKGAFELIMELIGEKKQTIEVNGTVNTNPLSGLSTDELRKMLKND